MIGIGRTCEKREIRKKQRKFAHNNLTNKSKEKWNKLTNTATFEQFS